MCRGVMERARPACVISWAEQMRVMKKISWGIVRTCSVRDSASFCLSWVGWFCSDILL